jgi:hypothetical protein
MAVERSSRKPDKPRVHEPSSDEAFWESEEGQDAERLFQKFINGEIDFDEAHRIYNKKWDGKPLSGRQGVQLPRMKQ